MCVLEYKMICSININNMCVCGSDWRSLEWRSSLVKPKMILKIIKFKLICNAVFIKLICRICINT